MNILIPNSWLREYLETDATPQQFADVMSLTSVSIERIDKVDDDFVYDIEVTTNRPDLMSVVGIAREASAVLPQAGLKAVFKPLKLEGLKASPSTSFLTIKNDPLLVNRIMAVVLEIDLKPSPSLISKRLVMSGIRSINNAVDVTNYIMREVGHPAHVFDYDRLTKQTLIIRKSRPGEKIITLDEKEYVLSGGDIVADNGTGQIVDLLGIMGTSNSVVTSNTKRVVLFLDNNNPQLLRKTSMGLGIRTEAAILNEKGVDPTLVEDTMNRGIGLLREIANAKLVSEVVDIYPNKRKPKNLKLTTQKINDVIGVKIDTKTITQILNHLGFGITVEGDTLNINIPTSRIDDVKIEEDIVEEVARVYGYHKIPNVLPAFSRQEFYHQDQNEFYWIKKVKDAFKFWGFNEVYTYSLVSEELFDGPIENALKLKNPLDLEHEYLRNSLIPSILQAAGENKERDSFKLFEISNIYDKRRGSLPDEVLHLAGIIKGKDANFYSAKGVIEQVFKLLGISNFNFSKKNDGIEGANVLAGGKKIGQIELGDEVAFELDLRELLKLSTSRKVYVPPAKFPPVIEDVRVLIAPHYTFHEVEDKIKKVSEIIHDVALLDVFGDKKTFRISFLSRKKSLTNEEVTPIRESIYKMLESEFKAKVG